ncbi:MAG: hypothetical protein K0R20_1318 [Actinomycetia bacterium]|jgi:hypothetical protein|nr:hypothetical protein [Actinomycetes bacterium]
MIDILLHFFHRLREEHGFVIGGVALAIVILSIVMVAGLVALLIPN